MAGPERERTSERCPACGEAVATGDPGQVLGTAQWRIIRGWGRATAYPVAFECPNGHSSTAVGELQRWFSVREL